MGVENFNGRSLTHRSFSGHSFNGHSMTGELLRVMVCPPGNAGWDQSQKAAAWRELGFQRAPDFVTAQKQHEILCRLLRESGAEV
jgi:arginine deiminase